MAPQKTPPADGKIAVGCLFNYISVTLKFPRILSIYNLIAIAEDTVETITQPVTFAILTMAIPTTIRLFDEISVFNEIINDNSKIHKLRECIDPYSYSIKRHRILRQVIAQLYFLQHTIELMSLRWYLADQDLLDEVGGCGYLQYIAEFHKLASLTS